MIYREDRCGVLLMQIGVIHKRFRVIHLCSIFLGVVAISTIQWIASQWSNNLSFSAPVPDSKLPSDLSATTITLFFSGDRMSSLEPCGCHSRQQGGVQYEAAIYEHATGPNIRMDLGDWASAGISQMPVESMQTRFLLRGMGRLGFDAVNIGLHDLELTPDYFESMAKRYSKELPPLLSANVYLKNTPGKRVFAPWKAITLQPAGGKELKVGVTGVACPSTFENAAHGRVNPSQQFLGPSYVVEPPITSLKPVIAKMRPAVGLLIVLTSGDLASAVQIARAYPQVDLIMANSPGATDAPLRREGDTIILCNHSLRGREIGVLKLRQGNHGRWINCIEPEFLPVQRVAKTRKELLDLIEEFKKETRTLSVKLPAPGTPQIYAGSASCQICHSRQHGDWIRTRHAQALQTLIGRGQQFNPACLKCHVTGFQRDNGFYAVTHRPSQQMGNVQCEVCHGAALEHVNTQLKIKSGARNWLKPPEYEALVKRAGEVLPSRKVAEEVCRGCHTPENDDRFNYVEKLAKVSHIDSSLLVSNGG